MKAVSRCCDGIPAGIPSILEKLMVFPEDRD